MKENRFPSMWVFFLVPFATVFTSLVFALLRLAYSGDLSSFSRVLGGGNLRSLSYFIYGLGAFIAFLSLLRLLKGAGLSPADIGWKNRITWKESLYALAAFAIAFLMYMPIKLLMDAIDIPMFWGAKSSAVSPSSPSDIVMIFLGAVVFGVIGEDFIFRGYLLSMFGERLGRIPTVLLSVLLFTMIHLAIGPGLTIYIIPWAFISCFLFLKFESLYPCLLFHVTNNFVSYLILPLLLGR